MVRIVHSEVKNKKVSEWTAKNVNKINKQAQLQNCNRPAAVQKYLNDKQEEEIRRRKALAAEAGIL